LLGEGANVNKRGGNYGTALQVAAFDGGADIVKILLDHGAEVNTEPIGTYRNPLQAACVTEVENVIRLLLEHGADVNAYGGDYNYAIIAAAASYSGRLDVVITLLEHGADGRIRGGLYGNAINAAAVKGNKWCSQNCLRFTS
ncbi:ankyrin, partial [Zopfia rhizophila CBS 207.26]